MQIYHDTAEGREAIDAFVDLIDAWNTRELSRLKTIYAPMVLTETGPKTPEVEIAEAEAFLAAVPDLVFTLVRAVGARGAAFVEWEMTGRLAGTLGAVRGGGRSVVVRGASLVSVEEGRVCSTDSWFDQADLARQSGGELVVGAGGSA